MALAAFASQAGVPATTSVRVALNVVESCVIHASEQGQSKGEPAVQCSFKAPHARQEQVENDPDPAARPGAKIRVTTLVF